MLKASKSAVAALLFVGLLFAEESPFCSPEQHTGPSLDAASELRLPAGLKVIDYDVWSTGPEVVILARTASLKLQVLSWHIGASDAVVLFDLPAGVDARSLVTHPIAQRLFIIGKSGRQSVILAAAPSAGKWVTRQIYQSTRDLRRLLVAPRPFKVGWDETHQQTVESFRLFFAERQLDGSYSIRSTTEDGKRDYQVIGPKAVYTELPDVDMQPTPNFVASALPASFHPGGHILIWQDNTGCFQQLPYDRDNWGKPSPVASNPCGGSLTVTPNGAALLHWKRGQPGITVITNRGHAQSEQATDYQFVSTPSSVPDGKGIVGLVERPEGQALDYVPIAVPLADVVNAWMFTENAGDEQRFVTNAGLFRALEDEQLYQLYDSEAYSCGGFDSATPTRPYVVTTDILWELVAAAYEGTFIVQERQQAMPAFWSFVESGRVALKSTAPNSRWARALDAAAESRSAKAAANSESSRISRAAGKFASPVFDREFDFAELKPRGHYTSAPEMAAYFKAVHYLTELASAAGAAELDSLPADVKAKAMLWISAYQPFIAPSRAPLVWNRQLSSPAYARHPSEKPQIFPLSWGFDNEVLFSTVFHPDWAEAEQIKGASGPRVLPSGMDLAAALGSGYARSLLKTDLADYPALGPVLDALNKRRDAESKALPNLYNSWIDALAIQWADDVPFPGVTADSLWKSKRLQTGLASWATLRHATVLVNERSAAECGEGGFEAVVLRPPRGYVEPDPKAFTAIASLFDSMEHVVASSTAVSGTLPESEFNDAQEPLRNGILRRLRESATKARLFASMAEKELRGEELTSEEYEEILYVGRVAEHHLLVFKSLANKDLALSNPDPIMKIADVAGGGEVPILEAAVGRPLEWDQVVSFYGRREIVKGSVYSYYELASPSPLSDQEWRAKVDQQRPAWLRDFLSPEHLSCPAKAPF